MGDEPTPMKPASPSKLQHPNMVSIHERGAQDGQPYFSFGGIARHMCMKRLHLIEIHDQDWCPGTVRDGETDYLQFVIATTKPHAAMVPILAAALQRAGTRQVLDLCSGAAGPWLWLQPVLVERGVRVSVCLTDKYPNVEVFRQPNRLTHP